MVLATFGLCTLLYTVLMPLGRPQDISLEKNSSYERGCLLFKIYHLNQESSHGHLTILMVQLSDHNPIIKPTDVLTQT